MVENQLKQMPGLTDGSIQESERNRIQIEETKLRTIMEVKKKIFKKIVFFLFLFS
jgi:hypothetical protein